MLCMLRISVSLRHQKTLAWGEAWAGLSDRSLQLIKNDESTSDLVNGTLNEKLVNGTLNEKQVKAVLHTKALMGIHVASKAEHEVCGPLLRATRATRHPLSCAANKARRCVSDHPRRAGARLQARSELDRALSAVRTLYSNGILEVRAETGAKVKALTRFRIASQAITQLVRLPSPSPAAAHR